MTLTWSVAVAFMPVLGDMQTVQRAELWITTIALQAYWPCHLGIDNLKKKLILLLI